MGNFTDEQTTRLNDADDDQKAKSFKVPDDVGPIQPDPSLRGYQDDLGQGKSTIKAGDDPVAVTGAPMQDLKEELDKLAVDERDRRTPNNPNADDEREYIEDLDEDMADADTRNAG